MGVERAWCIDVLIVCNTFSFFSCSTIICKLTSFSSSTSALARNNDNSWCRVSNCLISSVRAMLPCSNSSRNTTVRSQEAIKGEEEEEGLEAIKWAR